MNENNLIIDREYVLGSKEYKKAYSKYLESVASERVGRINKGLKFIRPTREKDDYHLDAEEIRGESVGRTKLRKYSADDLYGSRGVIEMAEYLAFEEAYSLLCSKNFREVRKRGDKTKKRIKKKIKRRSLVGLFF